MKTFWTLLVCMLAWTAYPQAIWRNFWTTNNHPTEVIAAGSNVTVQFSTPAIDQRVYTVNAIPGSGGGQTNNTVVIAGTNIIVTSTSGAGTTTYTVYGLTDTNVVSLLCTNIAAYQAYLATNNYAVIVTNIAAYQAYLATNYYAVVVTNIAEYQAYLATNNYAIIATNIAQYVSSLNTNVFASNVVSGGILPIGTVATNNPWPGAFLKGSTGTRFWSQDGGTLTNVPFAINTNYTANPNDWTNVSGLGFGSGVYGMTSYWAYAIIAGIGPVAVYYHGIDTNTVITTNGGTFYGAIKSLSVTSAAPGSNDLVTAYWVRNLFNVGAAYYAATNVDINATNPASYNQLVYQFIGSIPTNSFARAYAKGDFLTNNGYLGAVVTTNTFQSLSGTIGVNAYLGFTSSGGTPALNLHPEIYYSYDKTNWYGNYSAGAQAIFINSTNLYQWVIDFPTYSSTNAAGFYIERRFKVDSIDSGATRTLYFLGGTNLISGVNDASHITMQSPTALAGNAFLAANQGFTGSNTFSGGTMTWGNGNKTNGVYVGPSGEVLSNALGSVTISGGNVTATGVIKDSASYPPFNLNINATGTNIYITPTNGNLQQYTFTNTAYFTVLSGNTNNTETIRVELYGSNTLTWATANLSNSTALYPTSYASVFLLDREAYTNLFWGYRLR